MLKQLKSLRLRVKLDSRYGCIRQARFVIYTGHIICIVAVWLIAMSGSCSAQAAGYLGGNAPGTAGSLIQQHGVQVVKNQQSAYRIILSAAPSSSEERASLLLQDFIKRATGAVIPLIREAGKTGPQTQGPGIYIGRTAAAAAMGLTAPGSVSVNGSQQRDDDKIDQSTEWFRLCLRDRNLYITAGPGHATEYAVYNFAEKYLNGRKYDAGPAIFPEVSDLLLPQNLDFQSRPAFNYRESYYPMSSGAEDLDGHARYLNWHALQRFEDLWGLWGHSYNKLLPPARYFKTHPEYYALVNGSRQPSQLCLSNPTVLAKVIDTLKVMMADNPDAIYWSVAPNDAGGYCTCDACSKADQQEGGPQGSLIRFVNKVAAAFPDKKITTLAYGYTGNAPRLTRARDNVVVLVSSIDAFREQPIRKAPSAAVFRQQLAGWSRMAAHIFVWDYTVQFTNYLAPFPDLKVLADNVKYFKEQHVSGVFEQGSGDTYSDAAELNSFVQAKLLWNPDLDVYRLMEDFCKGYYGPGAPSVMAYLNARDSALAVSGRHLDIYGNPILESRGFLSRDNMEHYYVLLQQALQAVDHASVYAIRLKRLQLGLDYVALQQSRALGLEPGGFLQKGRGADTAYLEIRPEFAAKVGRFVHLCTDAGVKELSEGGVSPDAYGAEWKDIFTRRWPLNLALNADVTLTYPFSEDYPAGGKQTLTDGMTGFSDFSYNWLCFYGTNMEATIDMGTQKACGKISINFLDDPRHWIFLPSSVHISVSADGKSFRELEIKSLSEGQEHMDVHVAPVSFNLPAGTRIRYIKVSAINIRELPVWRADSPKKPMLAADEIMVTH